MSLRTGHTVKKAPAWGAGANAHGGASWEKGPSLEVGGEDLGDLEPDIHASSFSSLTFPA
jgi:hypothetical protein